MSISTQTLSTCSSRIPQPGLGQKGRGDSTLATKPASSSFSSAEDASVPAEDPGGCVFSGTKNVELMDPISPAKLVELMDPISPVKLASTVDDQLPPLLSMIIDGLPPIQISKYADEAEQCLHQYVERCQNVMSLDSCCKAGLCSASYMHPNVISLDRLVAISINYALYFLLDDLFFDTPDEVFQDQYGISRSACGSPEKKKEYVDHLDAIFGQQVQPSNPAPLIETMMWESGRDMLQLSNPEWFNLYVAAIVEHHHALSASYADIVQGHVSCFRDLVSYTVLREGTVGGKFAQLSIEFANDSYIPSVLRVNPYLVNLTRAASIHIGFVNDVFSYHKESEIEQNPRNLIITLMECEGKPFVQTVHMAIDVVNTYTRAIMDLGSQAWNSTLQNHLQDIKAFIAGNVYYSFLDKRYRHPDSIFPDLRDMTISWKILPHAEGALGL